MQPTGTGMEQAHVHAGSCLERCQHRSTFRPPLLRQVEQKEQVGSLASSLKVEASFEQACKAMQCMQAALQPFG